MVTSVTNLELHGVSTASQEKAKSAGTEENLFRLVPVFGHGARLLPHELVLVPGHGVQV